MDSIDRLLAEVKAEHEASANQQQNAHPPQVEQFKQPPPPSKSTSDIDNLLAEVKDDFEQKDLVAESERDFRVGALPDSRSTFQEEEQVRQQQLKAEELRQKQLQQQQLEELTSRAKAWIEKLDPFSPEGLWFERFAETYPSKLVAAIDYLKSS